MVSHFRIILKLYNKNYSSITEENCGKRLKNINIFLINKQFLQIQNILGIVLAINNKRNRDENGFTSVPGKRLIWEF